MSLPLGSSRRDGLVFRKLQSSRFLARASLSSQIRSANEPCPRRTRPGHFDTLACCEVEDGNLNPAPKPQSLSCTIDFKVGPSCSTTLNPCSGPGKSIRYISIKTPRRPNSNSAVTARPSSRLSLALHASPLRRFNSHSFHLLRWQGTRFPKDLIIPNSFFLASCPRRLSLASTLDIAGHGP